MYKRDIKILQALQLLKIEKIRNVGGGTGKYIFFFLFETGSEGQDFLFFL